MGNEIINQIVMEKESVQAYGPQILENLASAGIKFWQTEAKNKQKIKKLKNKYLVASNYPKLPKGNICGGKDNVKKAKTAHSMNQSI